MVTLVALLNAARPPSGYVIATVVEVVDVILDTVDPVDTVDPGTVTVIAVL